MSLEQQVLVELSQWTAHLAVVEHKRSMEADLDCPAYGKLVGYGRPLLPILLECNESVPHRGFAPLLRAIVGPRFDVPDFIYSDPQLTHEYCVNSLRKNLQR